MLPLLDAAIQRGAELIGGGEVLEVEVSNLLQRTARALAEVKPRHPAIWRILTRCTNIQPEV